MRYRNPDDPEEAADQAGIASIGTPARNPYSTLHEKLTGDPILAIPNSAAQGIAGQLGILEYDFAALYAMADHTVDTSGWSDEQWEALWRETGTDPGFADMN